MSEIVSALSPSAPLSSMPTEGPADVAAVSKTKFVLARPNLSVREILCEAAAAGVELTSPYVYKIRVRAGEGKRDAKRAASELQAKSSVAAVEPAVVAPAVVAPAVVPPVVTAPITTVVRRTASGHYRSAGSVIVAAPGAVAAVGAGPAAQAAAVAQTAVAAPKPAVTVPVAQTAVAAPKPAVTVPVAQTAVAAPKPAAAAPVVVAPTLGRPSRARPSSRRTKAAPVVAKAAPVVAISPVSAPGNDAAMAVRRAVIELGVIRVRAIVDEIALKLQAFING